ncbi:S8 family serine peptidase [Parasediminibacterium paludis]|uniref:S8 family serine peptidase n=1 Tax=Parasediminibacterium paludis TaxID=908966 RepID=A0ABV8PXF9_9BACT
MIKPFTISLLSTLCFSNIALAQTSTNHIQLKKDATIATEQAHINQIKVASLAKTKHWDWVITSQNGNKAYLVGVTTNGQPKYYAAYNNTIAAATTRASQLWAGGASGLNLSGSSAFLKNKLAIWDGGQVMPTHKELIGRITQKDSTTPVIAHATHVTGTLMASGVNPIAKGMAYNLQGIIAYDFYNDLAEITAEAGNIIISNHSYGVIAGWLYNSAPSDGSPARWEFWGRPNENEDVNFGYYDDDTKSLDAIAYNAPYYLYVKAAGNNRNQNGPPVGTPYYRWDANDSMVAAGNRPAGISSNDGYDILPTNANAKNILTVGAVNGIANGYTKPSDVVMSSFSSWGPTDDGRIKPDLVADGVAVTSCVNNNDSAYATYSGTSMASPNAAGSLLLLQEYYAQLKAGTFMRSATLKGLAIHTAEEAGDTTGPDYRFGWGLLNVEKAAGVIKEAVTNNNTGKHLLYENVLTNGGTFTKTIVANGNDPLVATICWTDVSANVTPYANALNDTTSKLVNDLDMRITKNGSTYYPWILDPANPAKAATKGDNRRDNVERINIDSAKAGDTYTITITHKGTLTNGSQAYSLLVSGVGGTPTNLPLNLLAFEAKPQGNTVLLNWQTANEVNTAYFSIERSIDGSNFINAGKVSAKGDGGYSFTDDLSNSNQQQVSPIYYRLQMVDKDGRFAYSKIVAVSINSQQSALTIYPIPATNTLYVQLNSTKATNSTFQVLNMQGKVLVQQPIAIRIGTNTFSVASNILARGNYIIKVIGETVYAKMITKE